MQALLMGKWLQQWQHEPHQHHWDLLPGINLTTGNALGENV